MALRDWTGDALWTLALDRKEYGFYRNLLTVPDWGQIEYG
jgi:hypothetical protein